MMEPERIAEAVRFGASYIGLVFFPGSPRYLDTARARQLAQAVTGPVQTVGLFVDASDETIEQVMSHVPLDILQLHGEETPERVSAIGLRTGARVMKVIRVEEAADLEGLDEHGDAADLILFDAKPPRGAPVPGGNGLSFDWRLLQGVRLGKPWGLAGGLRADNLASAVDLIHPAIVDVSSGIESRPGVKDPEKLRAFLEEAARLRLEQSP